MKKMTKVCMITIKHSPFDDRLFYRESRSLLKNGYYVYIISAAPNGWKSDGKHTNLSIEYINNVKTKSPIINRILALLMLFLKSLRVPVDVYHVHEPETFLIGMLLKIFTKKKLIYDVYEYYPDVIPLSHGFYRYFLIFMTFFEPLFCRFANGIITADGEIAKRYNNFNKNVCILYNFPCLDIFKSQGHQKDIVKLEGQKIIIYVGGISEKRGILELIKAIHTISKRHPSIKLLLAGEFETKDFKKKCFEYIKSNNIEKNIDFRGLIPHIKIPEYIWAADIGAALLHSIPKFHKNIPTKQFEYMACGKPIVGSNLPPIARYINEIGCGILVNPTNVDEIVDAIHYLIEHPKEAKKMGERGKKAVLEKYNWGKEEKKLFGFYNKVLGGVK